MKRKIAGFLGITLVTACVLTMVAEESKKSVARPDPNSPEMIERRRLSFLKHMGGWIYQPGVGSGVFAVLDAQNKVSADPVDYALRKISFQFKINTVHKAIKDARPTIETADGTLKSAGVDAAVILVDSPSYPALLGSPEKNWAFVNVAALAADGADGEKLAERVKREVWRGFSLACGGMDTNGRGCPLNAVTKLSDLDNLSTDSFSMERGSEILRHLKLYGITPLRRVTYRNACIEGWAPMPTNEFQLAIFQKIEEKKKKDPTNPIRIVK